jgi:hypothetical protein
VFAEDWCDLRFSASNTILIESDETKVQLSLSNSLIAEEITREQVQQEAHHDGQKLLMTNFLSFLLNTLDEVVEVPQFLEKTSFPSGLRLAQKITPIVQKSVIKLDKVECDLKPTEADKENHF